MDEKWKTRFKERGLKLTKPRNAILQVFLDENNYLFSAEKLHKKLMNNQIAIDLSTIYRNLDLFLAVGIIKKISLEGHVDQYRLKHSEGHHHHAICVACGKTQVLKYCPIPAIEKRLKQELEFEPQGHQLEITGYCKDCSKNKP